MFVKYQITLFDINKGAFCNIFFYQKDSVALQCRHNEPDCVSNHQPHDGLLHRLFRRRSEKTSKLRVTGLCAGNSPGPVNSPHKGPVTRKMFPFDYVIMGKDIPVYVGSVFARMAGPLVTKWMISWTNGPGLVTGWSTRVVGFVGTEKLALWRHNGHGSVSNHQPHECLLNRLFRRRSKKASKLRVTGLCAGNSLGTGEFPAQMASNAENASIWWSHHEIWGKFQRSKPNTDAASMLTVGAFKGTMNCKYWLHHIQNCYFPSSMSI